MLSIGIVGLPNVGKSSLFKALTKKQVDISNYAFTTIDPNVGVVQVPDKRLDKLAELSQSKKIIPTAIEFIDIAGLIKGAAQGEGLGNKFLASIREVDAIAHVVRVFEDNNIAHIHGQIDPLNDIEIINYELELTDMQTKEKREQKEKKSNQKLPPLQLLRNKKVIFVFNVSQEQLEKGWEPDEKTLEMIGENKYIITSLGMESPPLDKLIKESYKLLGLITFLTTGPEETRAWTTKENTVIPKAAAEIHTDFEKKFIKANVINWQELLDAGSWVKAKEKGTLKLVGKDYITQDGDVVEIKL